MYCVLSKTDELVTLSLFDDEYVTPLDIEIESYIFENQRSSQQQFIDIFCQHGYAPEDIVEELDRQCYCSVLRFLPSEGAYVAVPLGMNLWDDMCNRIHDQGSMIAGKLRRKGSRIVIDIYRTDFQGSELKEEVKSLGLRRAPVMRWTKQVERKEGSKCLDHLIDVLPFDSPHGRGDKFCVLQKVTEVVNRKPVKRKWAWLVSHPVVQLVLTPSRKAILKKVLSLSNGPLDWKGNLVSLYELKMNTDLSSEEVEEAVEYFMKTGIIRKVNRDYTPTGQGYTLSRGVFNPCSCVTFAVIRRTNREYQLEVSTPSTANPEIWNTLKEKGGIPSSDYSTPVVFPYREKSQVITVLDATMGVLLDSS